ncbi:MAG: hypothetical protein U0R65_03680 [Candidatus Nanopelagicales bacterium]
MSRDDVRDELTGLALVREVGDVARGRRTAQVVDAVVDAAARRRDRHDRPELGEQAGRREADSPSTTPLR